jgi:NADH-quinone oxidoreductase subunit G
VFSGNTTDICPVGALTTTDFRFTARPWEMGAHASICTQCPVGCNTTLNVRREPRAGGDITVQRVMPRQNEEVNEIWICDKGRFTYHYAESKKRLSHPLVRKNGEQVRASWDEAIKLAADKFQEAKNDLVVLASGRLANEDLFNLKKLADQAGGSALLYSRMGGGELTSLVGMSDSNFANMGAGSVIVVVASDLYQEAPIWYLRIKQAADRGATLIVLNPRETKLDRYASFVVRYAYGDEVKSAQDLDKRPGVIGALLGKDPKIAAAFREAGNVVVLYGSEGLGVSASASLASACANLLQETGFAGKTNSGLIGVWERANDQGAWEMGFRAEEHLVDALTGKTVYLAGVDPVSDFPVLAEALKSAKFVAVQDVMETATTQVADVVLPAQAFTEREGTYTSGERRVQRFYVAVPVTGEARPDFAITSQIAGRMGITLEGASAARAFDLLAGAVPSYAGLSYAKVSEVRPQWPLVGRSDLYYGGTTYENKGGMGAQLSAAASRGETVGLPKVEKEPASLRPRENELLAVPVNKLYNRGTTIMQSANRLRDWIGGPTITLHPEAAQKMGIEEGQLVGVSFDGASGEAVVKLDPTIPVGVALVPRDMGLPIREPVPATVSAPAKVK